MQTMVEDYLMHLKVLIEVEIIYLFPTNIYTIDFSVKYRIRWQECISCTHVVTTHLIEAVTAFNVYF